MNNNLSGLQQINSAEIIAIGTELLVGQTMDTNSYFLAQKFSELGINSFRRQVVGDHASRIKDAIYLALENNDLVVTTGGLGASDDDITMQLVAEIAGCELVVDKQVEREVRRLYPSADQPDFIMPRVPNGSIAFPNHNGTAPASFTTFDFKGNLRSILVLPGPPSENVPLFSEQIMPFLAKYSPARFIHRYVRMAGISEYKMEQTIKDLIDTQTNPTLAPYASEGEVVLRISQRLKRGEPDTTDDLIETVIDRLGEYIYEIGPRSLEQVLLDQMLQKDLTCAFAESCTGGAASARLISLPNTSKIFKGSIVSYSNSVKEEVLGVDPVIIEKYGAVSAECAQSMALNCQKMFKADLNLAITGIAGPSGATNEKPVGTVYFALARNGNIKSEKRYFSGDRQRIINFAVVTALDLLRRSSKE